MKQGLETQVEAVRRFNRAYTRRIGVLDEHLLESPFSLVEARVLYELAHRREPTATALREALAMDAGYLSRILAGLEQRGLLARRPSTQDGRRSLLALTLKGRRGFQSLDATARAQVRAMIGHLGPGKRQRLVRAMGEIQGLLAAPADPPPARAALRAPEPGDLGWVVQRHGALYAQEYGWDARFEALVGEIVARFGRTSDPARERCWIAERAGENLGCIFCVRKTKTVAQLRLLLVEPAARGSGLGGQLVDECVRFARAAGYRRLVLWTNDVLQAARRTYEKVGFRLVAEEKHHSFGRDLVGQTWSLEL